MTDSIVFQPWPKIARLNRDIVITEKIDGTNAAVVIVEDGPAAEGLEWHTLAHGAVATVQHAGTVYHVGAQSRKRLVFPGQDNFGFGLWVATHAENLVRLLGEGRHFGEWYGQGIQCGYGLDHKRFALFNTHRYAAVPAQEFLDGTRLEKVPVLYQGPFGEFHIQAAINNLRLSGSKAAPGFDRPEGVIVYHSASGTPFKVTLEGDESPKGLIDHG